MTILLTPPVKSLLINLLEGGGFSLQVAALECLNKCMRLSELDPPTKLQLAQAMARIIPRWQSLGPKESPQLPLWQEQLLTCLQSMLSAPGGKFCSKKISSGYPKRHKFQCRGVKSCLLHLCNTKLSRLVLVGILEFTLLG